MTPNKKIAGFAFHATQVLLTKEGQALKEDRSQGPSPQSDTEVQGDILETMKRQPVASHIEEAQYHSGLLGIWKQYIPYPRVFTTASVPDY